MLAGETDFSEDRRSRLGQLSAVPKRQADRRADVAHVKSALVLRVSKAAPGVPVEGGPVAGQLPIADPPLATAEPPEAAAVAFGRLR